MIQQRSRWSRGPGRIRSLVFRGLFGLLGWTAISLGTSFALAQEDPSQGKDVSGASAGEPTGSASAGNPGVSAGAKVPPSDGRGEDAGTGSRSQVDSRDESARQSRIGTTAGESGASVGAASTVPDRTVRQGDGQTRTTRKIRTKLKAPTTARPGPVERQSAHSGDGETGFAFGSYGRVSAATDGHGSTARPMNVVSHGTRLEEKPYLELDFYYRLKPYKGIRFQTVVTLGFNDDLFHYTGDWTAMLALRNLYLQADDVFIKGLSVWGGSRQYRGDDIYLLDYWPLDNLNTVGGGVIFQRWGLWMGLHAGVNRLRNEYQYQLVAVPGLNNQAEDVVTLDRQRFITSLKVSQRFGGGRHLGFKVSGYAEVHAVGSGTYNAHLEEDKQEHLPADQGWLVGAQFGMWNFGQRATHLNLFVRYAQGLAAYGEMAVPWGIAQDLRARRARDLVFALSGNYEWNRLSILVGGYLRYFLDADGQKYDWDDGWEYIVSLRPQIWVFRHFAQAFEVSYQGKWPFGLEPRTNQVERPAITKLSVMPMVVFGKGSYDRPQLRLVYTVALLNEGARLMYNELDPRRNRKVQHYIGLQAEWWYNSTYR